MAETSVTVPSAHSTSAQRPGAPNAETPPALKVEHLTKVFAVQTPGVRGVRVLFGPGFRERMIAKHGAGAETKEKGFVAVDDVSFSIVGGRSLAVVGESGSGKTTVARMIVGLERPTSGSIEVAGRVRGWRHVSSRERRRRAREVQIVFQDPYSSLDPRQTVRKCLEEALVLHFDWDEDQRGARVEQLLEQVGLDRRVAGARPRALSGGQRQRVAIARALACEPGVIICDEAVASLDVSIQAQVLNLMSDIREATGVSYLFISHDLAVVRQVSDDVIVMRRGQVVEQGPTDEVLKGPEHPYTKRLLAAIPRRGWHPAPAAGGATT